MIIQISLKINKIKIFKVIKINQILKINEIIIKLEKIKINQTKLQTKYN